MIKSNVLTHWVKFKTEKKQCTQTSIWAWSVTPSAMSWSLYCWNTVFCPWILLYINGWVKAGSSTSLCLTRKGWKKIQGMFNQSINQSTKQTNNQSSKQSIDRTNNQSIKQAIDRPNKQTINQAIDRSKNEIMNAALHLFHLPIAPVSNLRIEHQISDNRRASQRMTFLGRFTRTMSMTTSLRNSARNSAATLHTWCTASGSSALTWKMGAFTTRATSVQ